MGSARTGKLSRSFVSSAPLLGLSLVCSESNSSSRGGEVVVVGMAIIRLSRDEEKMRATALPGILFNDARRDGSVWARRYILDHRLGSALYRSTTGIDGILSVKWVAASALALLRYHLRGNTTPRSLPS